ncbi:MAG TPA: hypothetical protein VG759_04995 [Candidatus Angelobacter sp.]|nr:hypothetical protein [Candidatus Angelobacter sp.]
MSGISITSPLQASPGIPPLPWVPRGQDPTIYDIERVTALLKSAAYFPIFNIHNPAKPNQVNQLIPGLPFFIRSVDVNEQLHRFEINVCRTAMGIRATNLVGEPAADVHIQWTPIPDFYAPAPNVQPPPWLLNPFMSQRFCMLGGQLTFTDADHSGVHAFGTGHTYPATEGGEGVLRIGAAIDVLQGLGKFKGLQGAFCINGYIQPPQNLGLNLMIRMMDPDGVLHAAARPPIAPIRPIPDPDSNAVFMMFLGEVDPSAGVELIPSPDGQGFIGSRVNELLRLVRFSFDTNTSAGLRSITEEGPIVGKVSAILYFNFLDPANVIPIQTTNGVFTFFDEKGNTIGSVLSNMVEGRAMRTQVTGFPMPLFRFAGFGPILGGTGQFSGADGMMSMNSAVSVFPRTLSNLYVFRFYDPQGRLRAAWGDSGK